MVNKPVLTKLKNNQAYKLTYRHTFPSFSKYSLITVLHKYCFFKCYLITLSIVYIT